MRTSAQRRLRIARLGAYRLAGRDVTNAARHRERSQLLARHVPPGGVGAEIGVHKGYLTRYLLDVLQPSQLHLIDPWYLVGANWTWGSGDRSTTNALAAVVRRYAGELTSGRVVLHIGFDLEVLAGLPDACLDWVYLDTTHEQAHTRAELELLRLKVKPGGLITGDDWRSDPQHRHHGVALAVRSFVEDHGYDLVHASDVDQQWVIRLAGS
jgi:hypothetical protein